MEIICKVYLNNYLVLKYCFLREWCPNPADVRAAGLDLQSRPTEYKDFQSAKAMNWTRIACVNKTSTSSLPAEDGNVHCFQHFHRARVWSVKLVPQTSRGQDPSDSLRQTRSRLAGWTRPLSVRATSRHPPGAASCRRRRRSGRSSRRGIHGHVE